MAKDGYYFLIPLILLAGICFLLGRMIPGLVLLVLAGFVAFFFRNPERTIPDDADSIVSPADGKIVKITGSDAGVTISIFLSILNVHVNRAPISGYIESLKYRKGRFRLAFDDRASAENEQLVFTIRGDERVEFALIAGLVARRIVPWKKQGERVQKGERIALIRFGSRADVRIPPHYRPVVSEGERVLAGVTALAYRSE